MTDGHSRVEFDWSAVDVFDLERDGSVEPRINPSCCLMDFDTEPCNTAFPIELRDDIVGELDVFEGSCEHEVVWHQGDGIACNFGCIADYGGFVVWIDGCGGFVVDDEMVSQPDID